MATESEIEAGNTVVVKTTSSAQSDDSEVAPMQTEAPKATTGEESSTTASDGVPTATTESKDDDDDEDDEETSKINNSNVEDDTETADDRSSSPTVSKQILQRLLAKVTEQEISVPFLVLPNRKELPSYYEGPGSISKPISIAEITTKIDNNLYGSIKDFRSDIHLMLNNATTFNSNDSEIFEWAFDLREIFNKAYKSFDTALKRKILDEDEADYARPMKTRPSATYRDVYDRLREEQLTKIKDDVVSRDKAHHPPVNDEPPTEEEDAAFKKKWQDRKALQDHKVILTLHKTFAQGSSLANFDRQECSMPWLGMLLADKEE